MSGEPTTAIRGEIRGIMEEIVNGLGSRQMRIGEAIVSLPTCSPFLLIFNEYGRSV